jgi:hypothetical protein
MTGVTPVFFVSAVLMLFCLFMFFRSIVHAIRCHFRPRRPLRLTPIPRIRPLEAAAERDAGGARGFAVGGPSLSALAMPSGRLLTSHGAGAAVIDTRGLRWPAWAITARTTVPDDPGDMDVYPGPFGRVCAASAVMEPGGEVESVALVYQVAHPQIFRFPTYAGSPANDAEVAGQTIAVGRGAEMLFQSVSIGADGVVALGGKRGAVHLCLPGVARSSSPGASHVDSVRCVALRASWRDGDWVVVSGSLDGSVRFWDENMNLVSVCPSLPTQPTPVWSFALAGSDSLILLGLSTGLRLAAILSEPHAPPSLSSSPGGGGGGGGCGWTKEGIGCFTSVAISRTSACAVSFDMVIQIFSLDSGQRVGSLLGHAALVTSLSYSPGGNSIVSSSLVYN